jgi:hypothetical protein
MGRLLVPLGAQAIPAARKITGQHWEDATALLLIIR